MLDSDTCSGKFAARFTDSISNIAPAALGRRRIPLAAANRQALALVEAVAFAHVLAAQARATKTVPAFIRTCATRLLVAGTATVIFILTAMVCTLARHGVVGCV